MDFASASVGFIFGCTVTYLVIDYIRFSNSMRNKRTH